MPPERPIFRRILAKILPDGDYSVLNRLGPRPTQEPATPERKLTREEKILEALKVLEDLQPGGIIGGTPDQIVDMIKALHRSRLNIDVRPRWTEALNRLISSGKIESEENKDYTVDDPSNRIYRRSKPDESIKTNSNS